MSKYPVFKSTNSKLYFIQMGTLCHRFDSCPPDHREVAQLVEQKYCKKMCFVLLNEKNSFVFFSIKLLTRGFFRAII